MSSTRCIVCFGSQTCTQSQCPVALHKIFLLKLASPKFCFRKIQCCCLQNCMAKDWQRTLFFKLLTIIYPSLLLQKGLHQLINEWIWAIFSSSCNTTFSLGNLRCSPQDETDPLHPTAVVTPHQLCYSPIPVLELDSTWDSSHFLLFYGFHHVLNKPLLIGIILNSFFWVIASSNSVTPTYESQENTADFSWRMAFSQCNQSTSITPSNETWSIQISLINKWDTNNSE